MRSIWEEIDHRLIEYFNYRVAFFWRETCTTPWGFSCKEHKRNSLTGRKTPVFTNTRHRLRHHWALNENCGSGIFSLAATHSRVGIWDPRAHERNEIETENSNITFFFVFWEGKNMKNFSLFQRQFFCRWKIIMFVPHILLSAREGGNIISDTIFKTLFFSTWDARKATPNLCRKISWRGRGSRDE